MSVPSREAGKTAVALLLLARSDQAAVDELLGTLSADELRDLGHWLALVLSGRCGWSDAVLQEWRLREELVT